MTIFSLLLTKNGKPLYTKNDNMTDIFSLEIYFILDKFSLIIYINKT